MYELNFMVKIIFYLEPSNSNNSEKLINQHTPEELLKTEIPFIHCAGMKNLKLINSIKL